MALETSDALLGFAGVILGAAIGYLGSKRTADTDLKIAREKLESENRLSNAASAAIKALLVEPDWELRSFDAISKRIRGFSDDELRKLLVSCGAVAFEERGSGRELWGLRERNVARLQSRPDQQQLESEPSYPAPD
jgi:hypothetical protein